jgi:hypothetical protein
MSFNGFNNQYRLRPYFCSFVFTLLISGFVYGQDRPSYEVGMSLAQCGNLVELGKVVKTDDQINSGSIEVLIKTGVDFSCQLLAYTGYEKEIVDERKGKGDKTLKFENLSGKYAYRVVVRFNSEDFLCSNKVIDNIILKEK